MLATHLRTFDTISEDTAPVKLQIIHFSCIQFSAADPARHWITKGSPFICRISQV